MHIDVEAKAVGLWTVETWTGLREAWADLWPGWSLELWDDRSAEQVSRAAGRPGVLAFTTCQRQPVGRPRDAR